MKIPDSIRIGGINYEIEVTDSPIVDNGLIYRGLINFNDSKIRIDGQLMQHQRLCITLLHEIIHGVIEHAELKLDDAVEEDICNIISRGLYQVLQNNECKLFGSVSKN